MRDDDVAKDDEKMLKQNCLIGFFDILEIYVFATNMLLLKNLGQNWFMASIFYRIIFFPHNVILYHSILWRKLFSSMNVKYSYWIFFTTIDIF